MYQNQFQPIFKTKRCTWLEFCCLSVHQVKMGMVLHAHAKMNKSAISNVCLVKKCCERAVTHVLDSSGVCCTSAWTCTGTHPASTTRKTGMVVPADSGQCRGLERWQNGKIGILRWEGRLGPGRGGTDLRNLRSTCESGWGCSDLLPPAKLCCLTPSFLC